VVLQIGFHHRFTSEFRLARRLLESGVIGRVRAFQAMISEPISLVPGADNYRLKPELAGGLTLIDFGSHRLDQLRALAGEFAEIQAQFGSVGKHRQDDNVALLVRTRDDALGTISFHRYSQGAVSPTYLIGEKGVLCYSAYVVNPFHACPVAVFTAEPVPADLRAYARLQDWWSPPPPGWVGFHPPMENPYRLEYEAFFDAVRNGGRPPVTGEDGYRTLEIVLGAYQAFATGHPVELPLDPSADIPIPRFR
jgi:predicted dehydrogenase